MRPTLSEGIYASLKPVKDIRFEVAWINRISPRSTVRWFSIEESIGIYPSGFNINGTPNQFKNNLSSNGVLLMNMSLKTQQYELKFNNTLIDNISNTCFLQQEFHIPVISKSANFIAGFQVIRQDAVNEGGNSDQSLTYFKKGEHSWVFSTRVGINMTKLKANVNYTRIADGHQFLFPREWGREPFYTFMQRERNEGLSDMHAITINTSCQVSEQFKMNLGYGRYYLKDVTDYIHNRYGMPSYSQINLAFEGGLDKFVKGLKWNTLIVYKAPIHDREYLPKFVMNRINMLDFEGILNYQF